jgi:hypothetical protein
VLLLVAARQLLCEIEASEAVGKFVCDLFKEDLFKLKFYSVKTSS